MASGPAPDVYVKLSRDYAELEPIVHSIRELRKAEADLEGAEALLADPESDAEMKELAQLERDELTGVVDELTQKVRVGLLPKDKADSHDVILEVRAGTGGDEAALFAGDLFRMYQRFADNKGWKVEVMSSSEGDMGGFKEIVAAVTGQEVFGKLKFESGVHRVQRVPETDLVAVFTPLLRLLQFFHKRKKWMWTSTSRFAHRYLPCIWCGWSARQHH